MSAVNFYLSGNPVHDRVIHAMYEGCTEKKRLMNVFSYEPSDVAVVFGVYKSRVPASFARGRVISEQRSKNLDVLVLETGYINRGDGENHHYAAGLNGLNGRADFKNKGMSNDRMLSLNIKGRPWRTEGEHILLCAQVPWDASVEGTDHVQWVRETHKRLLSLTKRPVIVRHHPCIEKPANTLQEALKGAWAVVTFNSNSGVEAAIEGIPVFAADEGSMAWPIANKHLEAIETPAKPMRHQWLCDLAYAQWTLDEMREGRAWRHLFR